MSLFRRLAAVAASFACCVSVATAQDVSLTSPDGSIAIEGRLLGFDGDFYRVDSVYGELTLDASRVACRGDGCPDPEEFAADLSISGTPSAATVLFPALVEAFASRREYIVEREEDGGAVRYRLVNPPDQRLLATISINPSSTEEGLADLLAEEAQVALAFREPSRDEFQRAKDAGLGDIRSTDQNLIFALDAMVPIVATTNRAQSVTLDRLAGILSGEIKSWAELGAAEAPIVIHLREVGSAQDQVVRGLISDEVSDETPPTIRRHRTDADLVEAVRADPFAIGLTKASVAGSARRLSVVESCGYPLPASVRALKSEDYPLTVPHFMILTSKRQPRLIGEFIDFVLSPAAQPIVRRAGFVDQTPERIKLEDQGRRLAAAIQNAGRETGLRELKRLVDQMMNTERLTTTFRFRNGSADLDAQSQSNVGRLADAIDSGFFDGKTLVFAGFTDSSGGASANQTLSLRRAEAVRDAVRAASQATQFQRVRFEAFGFGEAMPMACDENDWGNRINRRVEVWAR
ncbi:MAG: phosphate ABC transporter substrate-binding/OmpA family protein [Pseudomonadota bacterium]